MEDQQSDPGDLTAGAVPQGKSARRHRLPRQMQHAHTEATSEPENDSATTEVDEAAPPAQDVAPAESAEEPSAEDTAAEGTTVQDTAAEAEPAVEDSAAETPDETTAVVDPVVAPRKRRFGWRRTRNASEPEPEPEAEPDPEADAEATAVEAESDPETDTDGETVAQTELGQDDPAVPGESEPEPILVPHRTAGRKLKVAAVAAGVVFVAAAAFAGAKLQPYLASRAEVQTKFEVAEVAAGAITTLWTYTPTDMDTLPDRAAKYLGGDFAADYRRYIDSIVESNKQAQVSNSTQVMGTAVESLSPTEASALVFTNSVATSPVTKGIPSLRYLSYRLAMERRDNHWLITRMTAVTSLDLTPRL
jgi:Mce-associated membrane protein